MDDMILVDVYRTWNRVRSSFEMLVADQRIDTNSMDQLIHIVATLDRTCQDCQQGTTFATFQFEMRFSSQEDFGLDPEVARI